MCYQHAIHGRSFIVWNHNKYSLKLMVSSPCGICMNLLLVHAMRTTEVTWSIEGGCHWVEYMNFGGEFRERQRKVIIIRMALSIDQLLEGHRKTRFIDMGSKTIQTSWVVSATFVSDSCNIIVHVLQPHIMANVTWASAWGVDNGPPSSSMSLSSSLPLSSLSWMPYGRTSGRSPLASDEMYWDVVPLSMPWLQKMPHIAESLYNWDIVLTICGSELCWLEHHHVSLTAGLCLDSVNVEQRPLGEAKSSISER